MAKLGIFDIPRYPNGGQFQIATPFGSQPSIGSGQQMQIATNPGSSRQINVGGPGGPIGNPTGLSPCQLSLINTGYPTPCPPNTHRPNNPNSCESCVAMGEPTGGTPLLAQFATNVQATRTVDCPDPTSPRPATGKGSGATNWIWNTSTCQWVQDAPLSIFAHPSKEWATRPQSQGEIPTKRQDIASGIDVLRGLKGAKSRSEYGRFQRTGGGAGGGSAQDMEAFQNPLLTMGSPYLGKNVAQFNKGGKLTKKELAKVKKAGRMGDTELAHVNPYEKAMLQSMGGSGTINPYTGLREYGFLGDFFKSITSPFRLIIDTLSGREDPLGRFVDNLTFGATNLGPDDPSKRAVVDPDTGGYKIEIDPTYSTQAWTATRGGTQDAYLGFDPTGEKTGAAGMFLQTPSGIGNILSQVTEGDPWATAPGRTTQPGLSRMLGRRSVMPKDESRVVNPFGLDMEGGGDKAGEDLALQGYRWDLENPYIRENVDIFDQGGKMKTPYSYQGGGYADFARVFNNALDTTVAMGQADLIRENNQSRRTFTSGGRF